MSELSYAIGFFQQIEYRISIFLYGFIMVEYIQTTLFDTILRVCS